MVDSPAREAPDDNGDHPDDTILEEDDVNWTDDVAPVRYPDNPVLSTMDRPSDAGRP
jgi:hypothetical protein